MGRDITYPSETVPLRSSLAFAGGTAVIISGPDTPVKP